HQTKVAVNVPDFEAEQPLHEMVVEAPENDAMPRIRAADLVAVDHVGLRREMLPQNRELRRVVLGIAVRIENELLRRGAKPGLKGSAVSAVHGMMHDSYA